MTILNAGSNTTLSLPVGQVARFNGTGLVQVVPPIPQGVLREAIPLFAGRQTAIGPFAVAVTLFLSATGSAVEYFTTVPVSPLPPQAEPAYVIELASLAALQSLALAGLLDPSATYVDTTTGQKYWATNGSTFLSAGANLDSSNLNWVQSGLLPPASGALAAATLSAGVAYVEGNRIALAATPLLLTATRDNYIDLRRDGTVIVTPVTVAAAAPAIPANSMRLGFSRTDATTVTARTISAFDSLGNWMYNTVAQPMCVVYRATSTAYGGAAVPLPFPDADIFDNTQTASLAGMHDPSTNNSRFTLPSNGAYQLDVSLLWFSAVTPTVSFDLFAQLDGVTINGFPHGYQGAQATQNMRMSGTLQGRAGQYVEANFNPNGASGTIGESRLTIVRVG